jgi:hypothetical protein
VEHYFLARVTCLGHPTVTYRGVIDGVPINASAGFPKLNGWNTALLDITRGFVALRMSLMQTVLKLVIEHNGHQPFNIGGSFFFRVQSDEEMFLEVDFREELDGSCADPVEILGLHGPEDFTLARILMAGQRKLTLGEAQLDDGACNHMSMSLARALQKQQNNYRWQKGEGVLAGRELNPELPLRAARLELAMIEEGFQYSNGTLGPTLRHLAEQYLT